MTHNKVAGKTHISIRLVDRPDKTTPSGKTMFQMLAVFSEFERAMIRDRVKSGLARAREQGRVGGRPPLPEKVAQAILDKRTVGLSIRKIAKEIGVGVSTVQRTIKAQAV